MAGPRGPLRDHQGYPLPGLIEHLGGGQVRLDGMAVLALRGKGDDGRITDQGDVQVIVIGADRYPLWEEQR